MQSPGYVANTAQRRLAEEVTRFVHGEEGLRQALKATEALAPGAGGCTGAAGGGGVERAAAAAHGCPVLLPAASRAPWLDRSRATCPAALYPTLLPLDLPPAP